MQDIIPTTTTQPNNPWQVPCSNQTVAGVSNRRKTSSPQRGENSEDFQNEKFRRQTSVGLVTTHRRIPTPGRFFLFSGNQRDGSSPSRSGYQADTGLTVKVKGLLSPKPLLSMAVNSSPSHCPATDKVTFSLASELKQKLAYQA